MMEDKKVAKAFLSAIIEEEVLDLDFSAQEHTLRQPRRTEKKAEEEADDEDEKLFLTVCRFDFLAKIRVAGGGFKTVLIELQKAKFASDIMRFRRYIGVHYQNPDNIYGDENGRHARQIYCIFLLGYDIAIPGCPVIQVDCKTIDGTTKKELEETRNEFISSLHHRSWIIQISQLKRRRRNDVEKLLSVFDQENRAKNHHILSVDEKDFPKTYGDIINRLRMAFESEDMQIEMEMEDDILSEIKDKERQVAEMHKELKAKDKVIEESKKALEEKDKALEEKEQLIETLKAQLAKSRKQQKDGTGLS
jgi:predicted ribosome quality control (RQC) complex YloA/Tae2 family protein